MDAGHRLSEQNEPAWKIAVISASILLLELTFIRHIPSEVRSISYFTNLILMSSFFGLGLGCIMQNSRALNALLPTGLALVCGFTLISRGIVIYEESVAVHYWLEPPFVPKQAIHIPVLLSAILAFLFSALPFVALGQSLARYMEQHPRLVAYSWDIFGSLFGTCLFSISSYLHMPPWLWPVVLMGVWALLLERNIGQRITHFVSGFIFLCFSSTAFNWHWSPYYLVQHTTMEDGIIVWVNSTFLQHGLDLKAERADIVESNRQMIEKFSRPYEIYRQHNGGKDPASVLILGAGTGNDVNIALINRAQHIDAVEIDGTILQLGVDHNSSKPYSDPRVQRHVDDARHFIRTTSRKYDLVIYGTLDSVALLSGVANLRLENYAYTVESLRDVRDLLNPGGMVGMYYSVFKPWLYARIFTTFSQVFQERIKIEFFESEYLFNTLLVAARDDIGLKATPEELDKYSKDLPLTDDWPYLYLQEPTIAPVYQKLFLFLSVLIACAFLVLRRVQTGSRAWHLDFLFLGLGFTLMEAAAIVRMALLFGSTWVVNAVVFAAALLTIFLANLLVMKRLAPPLKLSWPALFLMIVCNYLTSVDAIAGLPFLIRILACGMLVGLPILFAAFCFSHLFEREASTGYPLGINLIGAMAGGGVEYISMAVGMRAVWLVVLGIYLAACVSSMLKGSVTSRA